MKKNIVKLLVLVVALMSVLLAFASCGCSHEEEVLPAKEATCSAEGLTEGKKCKLCGEILVKQETVAKKAHAYATVEKQDATCEVDGCEAGEKCSVCGDVKTGCEVIPAGHKTIDIAEEPAKCYATGTAAGKRCTVCLKDVEGFEELPMIPHTLDDIDEIAPTCVAAGSAAGKKCTAEGCSYYEGLATLEPLGHQSVAAEKLEPTCTTDGHQAGNICSRCQAPLDGYETIPALGHTITNENITVTTAPALGVDGAGTATCPVCKTTGIEVVLPAIPGRIWDFSNADDTGLRLVDSNKRWVLSQKTEGDKTTAELNYNNSLDGGKYNEANLFWEPTTPLQYFTHTTMYVFETDMIINDVTPTDAYAAESSPWFMYLTLTDNTGTSTDNHHVTNTCYILKDAEGNPVVTVDGKDTAKSPKLPYKQWFNLKVVYTMNPEDTTVNVKIFVDGQQIHNRDLSRTNKDGTLKFDETTVGFKLKFKNNSKFNSISMSFDNSKFEELGTDVRTVKEAIAIGSEKAHNVFTEEKYTVTGTITEIYNTQYGNMKIKDAEGNILTIYGTYSADGSTRYDALAEKPAVGDTITLYGVLGKYNSDVQMKSGWIVKNVPHTHEYENSACKICGASEPVAPPPAQDSEDAA